MSLEDYIKDLAPELQERARACGSVEELLALAKEEKVPVPDEALEAVAGGEEEPVGGCLSKKCKLCGSRDTTVTRECHSSTITWYYKCNNCGFSWFEER